MGIENGTHIGDFVVLIISPQIEAGAYLLQSNCNFSP